MKSWIFLFFSSFLFLFAQPASAQSPADMVPQQDVFTRGVIRDVVSEKTSTDFGTTYIVQTLNVEVLEGKRIGETVTMEYETVQGSTRKRLEKGDRLILGEQYMNGEPPLLYVSDVYRLRNIWAIIALFFVLTIALAGWKGLRSFAGLFVSFVVIFAFVIPQILEGKSPVWMSFLGAIIIALVALYLAHGFKVRTTIAFVSTLITVSLAFGLAAWFIRWGKLFGIGTEDAFYLQFAGDTSINLQGLLLGGIVLGTLGVLDDITTAQAAAVEELHKANDRLPIHELYKRGFEIGREHIVALVNTLALAYTGAAFPLLLLLHIYERPLWVTLNSEMIVEEIVRILVGSIALILAVPITTFFAAWYFGRKVSPFNKVDSD